MKTPSCLFQVGDKVKVKNGTIDPDFNFEISDWSGEIERCFLNEYDNWRCTVIFDEKTLHVMGEKFIAKCDRLNFDHTQINLDETELELLQNVRGRR